MKRKLGTDQGSTRLKYFLGFVPDVLIRKMKMGLENGVVCITEMTKAFIMSLRWLDTVFQGKYLPSLSINYVAINKVLEKLPPQLY